ncbi:adenylyl-sulfate kinase 3 [Triticum aestivum]|uniref:adenylyl-sulfate kinase 3 n=1 Tax=Triticum aestivum TaxID=4565 RepID=UPI001D01432D|nr:adenylyl-sulfate kinase 3-like [Triticum aestivum]
MLAKDVPRPCSGAGRHGAPVARLWSVGVAGGPRRGGAGGRLVAADAGERMTRSEAVPVVAVAAGKQPVNGSAMAALYNTRFILSRSSPYKPELPGIDKLVSSTVGKSTNILWHDCPIGQFERQKLLNQKGCVVWITGLSGSGKSTLACALSRELHSRGHLTYILDGDNLRHGLNRDLCFEAKDRAENIRRVGISSKLFADAGLICIASLISPYRSERSACRKLLHNSTFIEVFLDVPLEVCEARDPKGLYKLARAGKIKGFTGIDDPYEPPSDCEIVIQCKAGDCATPKSMADQVVSYLEANEFLQD